MVVPVWRDSAAAAVAAGREQRVQVVGATEAATAGQSAAALEGQGVPTPAAAGVGRVRSLA